MTELAEHRLWAVPMTKKQIEHIVDQVLESSRDGLLIIDDQGVVTVLEGGEAFAGRANLRAGALGGRKVIFDMHAYDKRPSREQVLADFKDKADRADFRPKR